MGFYLNKLFVLALNFVNCICSIVVQAKEVMSVSTTQKQAIMPEVIALSLSNGGRLKLSELNKLSNIPSSIKNILCHPNLEKGQILLDDAIKVTEWMHVDRKEKNFFISDICKDSTFLLPQKRAPVKSLELKERLKRLQAMQDNEEYKKMVRNVQTINTSARPPTKSHVTTGFNMGLTFLASVFACTYTLAGLVPSLEVRVVLGVIVGTILVIIEVLMLIRSVENDVKQSKSNLPRSNFSLSKKID